MRVLMSDALFVLAWLRGDPIEVDTISAFIWYIFTTVAHRRHCGQNTIFPVKKC